VKAPRRGAAECVFPPSLIRLKTRNPLAKPSRPSPICPPPEHRSITVTNQIVAALVTPIAIAAFHYGTGINAERMPSGSRMISMTTNESDGLPFELISQLVWIMARKAARPTGRLVR
jgi:hypothetical protein